MKIFFTREEKEEVKIDTMSAITEIINGCNENRQYHRGCFY